MSQPQHATIRAPRTGDWRAEMPVMAGAGLRASGGAWGMVVGLRQSMERFEKRLVAAAPAVVTEPPHPFYIYASGKLHAGTVNGSIIPTLGGAPIGETGNALSLAGDFYVYICNIWALTFGSHDFLVSVSLSSSSIVTNASPLDDDFSSGTMTTYKLIAQVVDGMVQREQTTTTNLFNGVCDATTESGQAVNSNWGTA